MSVKTLQELCTRNVVNNFDTNGAVISIYDLGEEVCTDIIKRLWRAKKVNDSNIERLQFQGIESLKIDESDIPFSDKVCCWLADIVLAGLEELNISCIQSNDKFAVAIVEKYKENKKVATSICNISELEESQTSVMLAALRTLRITVGTSSSFEQLPRMLNIFASTLKHLEIDRGVLTHKKQRFYDVIGTLCLETLSLHCLNICDNDSFTVTSSMQHLRTLELDRIRGLTDQHVLSFLEVAGSNIQHLSIRFCYSITNITLQNMQLYCPNLVSLDLSSSAKLTWAEAAQFFATASLEKLKGLKLRSDTELRSNTGQLPRVITTLCLDKLSLSRFNFYQTNVYAIPQSMQHLKTLELKYIAGLTDFQVSLFLDVARKNIQHLCICDSYIGITDSTLQKIQRLCPNLVSLDLSNNESPTSAGLEQFFATASLTKLQRLSLVGNSAVTDNVVAKLATAGQLSYLNLHDCHKLTNQSLQALGSIPTLKYINLDNCARLNSKDVEDFMTCHGLENCDVYGELHVND